MLGLYIALIIAAVLGLLAVLPIRAVIRFSADEKEISLKYLFLKLKIYPQSKAKPDKEPDAEEDKTVDSEENGKTSDKLKGYYEITKLCGKDIMHGVKGLTEYILGHAITINEINISARFGFEDAMATGLAAGAVNGAVYNILGLMDKFMKLKKWNVSLNPDFENQGIKAGMYCMLSTNIAHVVVIGVIFLRTYLKIKRKLGRNKK